MAKAKGRGAKGKGGLVVTGVREIDRKLRKLEYAAQRKIVRKAMDRALKPMLEHVREVAPVLTGETRKHIKLRAGKSRRGVVRREIRVGDKQMGADFNAQRVEFGTRHAPPHPFMTPVYESDGPSARDAIEREIRDGLVAEVK